MAMTCLNNRKNDSFILSTIDELVPSDHKVRELEAVSYTHLDVYKRQTLFFAQIYILINKGSWFSFSVYMQIIVTKSPC